MGLNKEKFSEYIKISNRPRYLYWDKVKYFKLPENTDNTEFWYCIETLRMISPNRRSSPIQDERERLWYTWEMLPQYQEFFHKIDMELGGKFESDIGLAEKDRQKFISRGLIEESIASSQLEGANITRKSAKDMIQAKREPRNRSEQMILNNYEVMLKIEDSLKDSKFKEETLLELHEATVKDTIDSRDIGRFRFDRDRINVGSESKGVIYHIPPLEKFMLDQLDRFLQFANDEIEEKEFIHPVIKATILHFWIGYLHPFVDGNGRIARALFYWYLLRHGYWAFTYMPLSRVIKKSAGQYRDAYLYSEQDDCDLTYFIDYILNKIIIAEKEFVAYFSRKAKENEELTRKVNKPYQFNDRQI